MGLYFEDFEDIQVTGDSTEGTFGYYACKRNFGMCI
jgi:hypothetical protein